MVEVKSHTKKVNGKTIKVKSYARKEPPKTAGEYLKSNTKKQKKDPKTMVAYVVQGNYGSGWEDVTEESSTYGARNRLKEYNDNDPYPHRLIQRRVPFQKLSKNDEKNNLREELDFKKRINKSLESKGKSPRYCDASLDILKDKINSFDSNSYERKTLTKEQANELFSKGGTPSIKPRSHIIGMGVSKKHLEDAKKSAEKSGYRNVESSKTKDGYYNISGTHLKDMPRLKRGEFDERVKKQFPNISLEDSKILYNKYISGDFD